MTIVSLCNHCKYFKGLKDGWNMTCEAFPNGIPVDFDGDKEKCKDDLRFELKEGKNLPF